MRISVIIVLLVISLQLHAQSRSDSLFACIKTDTVLLKEVTPPEFPGGRAVWNNWIAKWVLSKTKKQKWPDGTYPCYFTIDTTGRLTNIGFCGSNKPDGEIIIRDILSRSPSWKPAFNKKGGKISYTVKQPITLYPSSDEDE